MKRIRTIYHILPMLLLAACNNDLAELAPQTEPTGGVVIVNSAEGAQSGELMVKFKPEAAPSLDKAVTRSVGAFATNTRSGITDMDRALDNIGSYEIERVFPINEKEDMTRASGLNLWYVIRFDEDTDLRKAANELAQVNEIAKIQYSHRLKKQVRRPVSGAAPQPGPVYMTSNGTFNDPGLARQWHYINDGSVAKSVPGADVNCAEAWQKCQGDPSIIVAVMDEGVMWSHPDLQANMWKNEGEEYKSKVDNDGNGYAGDVYGYNFAEDSPIIAWNSSTDTGHGTHVAGTIAAVNNNGEGVCGIAGGSGNNDGVKIMSIQIFSGDYGVTMYNEARGIKYAADNGAVILQCSWGYNSPLTDPTNFQRGPANDEEWAKACSVEKEALDYFVHNAGSPTGVIDGGLVIFAAGNEYAPAAGYPGAYGDFISVSATDAAFMPASYTNYDRDVDIAAPGGDIDYHLTNEGQVYSTMPPMFSKGEGYGYMEGTSMACPHVSGVAALGLSYAAKLHKHFTAEQFKELVLQATRDMYTQWNPSKLCYKYYSMAGESTPFLMELNKYYQGRMGAGMIDANKMLSLVEGNGVKLELPNVYLSVGADNGQTIDLFRFFDNGEALTFTAESANPSVATVTVEGQKAVVTGVAVGSTTFTVTASDGTKQTAEITVRRKANDNGWL